jgi:hypothetical protein
MWELASDFQNAADRVHAITKVEMLTEGPTGLGSRFREWRGRQMVELEVVAWSPPNSYTLRGVASGIEVTSTIRCVPEAEGTRLEMESQVRPRTLTARLLSPLIYVFSRMMLRSCAKDLRDIAVAAERER